MFFGAPGAEMFGPELIARGSFHSNGNKVHANTMLSRSDHQAVALIGFVSDTKSKGEFFFHQRNDGGILDAMLLGTSSGTVSALSGSLRRATPASLNMSAAASKDCCQRCGTTTS